MQNVEASAQTGSGGPLVFGERRFSAAMQAAIYTYTQVRGANPESGVKRDYISWLKANVTHRVAQKERER